MPTPVRTEEVTTKIEAIITEKLGVEETTLPRNASFTSDLGLDSLDVLETFAELEKRFHIRIADEDAEKLRTVGSVIDYVLLHMN